MVCSTFVYYDFDIWPQISMTLTASSCLTCLPSLMNYSLYRVHSHGYTHWQNNSSVTTWTRQIIKYRATATLRWLQIKQYAVSNEGGGVVHNQRQHLESLIKYLAVHLLKNMLCMDRRTSSSKAWRKRSIIHHATIPYSCIQTYLKIWLLEVRITTCVCETRMPLATIKSKYGKI